MIEYLKSLSQVVDVVAIFGAPNIHYLLKSKIDGNAMILYRGSTNECKILIPLNVKKFVEGVVPRNCIVVGYSYDAINMHGYVLGRSFQDIALGVIKSLAKKDEDIGVPLLYIDASSYSTLLRYWRVKDISRDIRIIRSKKSSDELNALIEVHKLVKHSLDYCKNETQNLLNCIFDELHPKLCGIYLETLVKLDNLVTLRLAVRKGIFIVNYRWSLPLSKEAEDLVTHIDNTLENTLKKHHSRKCADLIKNIKAQLQQQNIKAFFVNICGIGTEECEYPSICECLYEDTVLHDGMTINIEVVVNENMYIPKFLVIRDKKIEVY